MNSNRQNGLTVFQAFPQIAALGGPALQSFCDAWMKTPNAREFAVEQVRVSEKVGALFFGFVIKFTHELQDGETYHFPMDDLLYYVADNGVPASERDALRRLIQTKRQKFGPEIFQRFPVKVGPRLPLFIRCPNCKGTLGTGWKGLKSEKRTLNETNFGNCPGCKLKFPVTASDLFFLEYKVGDVSKSLGDKLEVLEVDAYGRIEALRMAGMKPMQPGQGI